MESSSFSLPMNSLTLNKDKTTLPGTILHLLQTGSLSDVTIRVGPKKFGFDLHKVIIGGRSEVFTTMMQQRWNETDENPKRLTLNLPSTSVAAFIVFINYLYSDVLDFKSIDEDIALEVLKMAHLYQVPGMIKVCKKQLSEMINDSNCLKFHINSRLIDKWISQMSFRHFLMNIRKAAENDRYLGWDAETVRTVLMQDYLPIKEIDLFKALLKWSQFEVKEGTEKYPRSQAYPELLKLIRFPVMEVKTFAEEVVPTNALSNDENVQMFLYFNNPDTVKSTYETKTRQTCLSPQKVKIYTSEYLKTVRTDRVQNLQTSELRIQSTKTVDILGLKLYTPAIPPNPMFPSIEQPTQIKIGLRSRGEILQTKNYPLNIVFSKNEYIFDSPIKLKPTENYDLLVEIQPNYSTIFQFMGGDRSKESQNKCIALQNDAKIILDFNPHDINGNSSFVPGGQPKFIRSVIFSGGTKEVPSCAIV